MGTLWWWYACVRACASANFVKCVMCRKMCVLWPYLIKRVEPVIAAAESQYARRGISPWMAYVIPAATSMTMRTIGRISGLIG